MSITSQLNVFIFIDYLVIYDIAVMYFLLLMVKRVHKIRNKISFNEQ